jgi:hypothetical protein
MQFATNYIDSTVYAVCYQLYRLYCICSMLSITHSLHSIQTFSLTSFYCVTILQWTNTVQCNLQMELWCSFNILRFTALRYTDYKHALWQCPGLHQPILHNRICQTANCQKAFEYIQLIQQVCTLTVLQVEDTRCLIPTCVQLMMKLKQDATSELGGQLYKKSLFIYRVRIITVHVIMKK